ESIGDFFLAPSRYLFGGKTIRFDEKGCEVYQSYHYEKLHWLKTTLACALFPITETLGATFKGISYLSANVRRRHRQLKRALRELPPQSHLEEYRAQGIGSFHSDEYAPCLGLKRPSKLSKRQATEIAIFKEIATLLDANNILYWVDCGTALGAYRYGGIIPWDWDIDFSIMLEDHDNVKRLLGTLDPKKYQIQDWSGYTRPKSFLKLYVRETKNFIDIYHYKVSPEDQTIAYYYTYEFSSFPDSWKQEERMFTTPLPISDVFPLKKCRFDGLTVWAPNHIIPFLQSKYGENLDPVKVWDEESKSYKKIDNHPYYLQGHKS
ncbi:MAG: LicD family protein, partial [Verrucomicrobia bacterium]|nr:LicD family protein [Verrucomicrobiota bacterium]